MRVRVCTHLRVAVRVRVCTHLRVAVRFRVRVCTHLRVAVRAGILHRKVKKMMMKRKVRKAGM